MAFGFGSAAPGNTSISSKHRFGSAQKKGTSKFGNFQKGGSNHKSFGWGNNSKTVVSGFDGSSLRPGMDVETSGTSSFGSMAPKFKSSNNFSTKSYAPAWGASNKQQGTWPRSNGRNFGSAVEQNKGFSTFGSAQRKGFSQNQAMIKQNNTSPRWVSGFEESKSEVELVQEDFEVEVDDSDVSAQSSKPKVNIRLSGNENIPFYKGKQSIEEEKEALDKDFEWGKVPINIQLLAP